MTFSEIDELLKDATHISFSAAMRLVYLIFPNEYESENLYNVLLAFFERKELTIQIRRVDNNKIDFYIGDNENFVTAKNLEEKIMFQSLDDFIMNESDNIEYDMRFWPIELYVVNLRFNIHTGDSK